MLSQTEADDLSSLLSFDLPVPRPRPRTDSRLLKVLRVGKITTDRFEELCLVRNVGVGGLMAHVHSPLVQRQRVRVELRSDRRLWGSVLWIKDEIAGIGFDGQVDLEEMLARENPGRDDRRSSGPRLNIDCRARLRVGSKYHRVRLRDLGQGGAGIASFQDFEHGEEAVLTLAGLDPIRGAILRSYNGRIGMAFNKPISFDEITAWLRARFGRPCVEIQAPVR